MYDFLRVAWAATTNTNRENLKSPVGLMVTIFSPVIMVMLFVGAYGAQRMVAGLPGLCAYAVMNACVIQVSGAVAIDRQFPWDAYLRTLPGSWLARLLGKAMSCFLFALLALVPVVLIVGWPLGEQLLVLAPRLLFGAVLTAVLGIGIGLMLGFVGDPNAVGAISGLIFFLLAAAGGMFTFGDAAGTTPPDPSDGSRLCPGAVHRLRTDTRSRRAGGMACPVGGLLRDRRAAARSHSSARGVTFDGQRSPNRPLGRSKNGVHW